MNKILILALMLTGLNAMANHHEGGYKHMIDFGNNELGADYSDATIELDNNGTTTEADAKVLEINLNYAHAINSHLWIKGGLNYESTDDGTDTDTIYSLAVSAIYNFDHHVTNSFYAELGLGLNVQDNETDNLEADLVGFFVEFGKRWSLEKCLGIKNLS